MKQNEKSSSADKYTLQSVGTALSILDLFFEHEELNAPDVARYLNINRSTAYRLLVTLENSGYITKMESSRYRLSVKVSSLGQIAQSRRELISQVHPHLLKVSEITGETAHLVIMEGPTHVTFIDKVLGALWLRMDILIGYTQYAHYTATGKAILSYQSDQFINQYLKMVSFEKHTPASIGSAKELLEVLDSVKAQGYACDNEETELGLSCIAVPLFTPSGILTASISCSGPTTRMMANKELQLNALREAADKIQKSFR